MFLIEVANWVLLLLAVMAGVSAYTARHDGSWSNWGGCVYITYVIGGVIVFGLAESGRIDLFGALLPTWLVSALILTPGLTIIGYILGKPKSKSESK